MWNERESVIAIKDKIGRLITEQTQTFKHTISHVIELDTDTKINLKSLSK
jgi:hypothetical protein